MTFSEPDAEPGDRPDAGECAAQLIRRFEGFSPQPYRCPAGYPTIGYGHVIGAGENFPTRGISEAEAQALLLSDLEISRAAVRRMLPTLLPGREAALISFTFNLGAGALQRSALRRKILRGEHNEVPQEFMKWVWAGGRKLKGLMRRRAAEAECYAGAS